MINICFITDENYLIPTMVAIQSLIKNTKNEVCVNIIVDNVYQGHLNTFKEIETQKVKINIINIKNPCENIDTDHLYVSKSAMIKFILPEIFKDLDKILYLDGDILVLDDLSQLYNTDIESHYIAAVADMAEMLSSAFEERVGVKKYFNSGILSTDCNK